MPGKEAFEQTTVLFIVPLGVLLVAWLIQRQYNAKLNSGADLFVFLASLDLTYLAKADAAVPRINPDFAPVYNSLFVCSLIFSLIMLCYGRDRPRSNPQVSASSGQVLPSWSRYLVLGVRHCYD